MSRRRSSLVLLVASALSLAACGRSGDSDLRITSDDRRPARPRDPNDKSSPAEPALVGPVIVLDEKQLTIDGVVIPPLPHVSDFVARFGAAERKDPSGNTIHIYEHRGLLLYERPDDGRVIELTVIYGEQKGFPFMPKKMFAGTLIVCGMRMGPKTTLDAITTKLTAFKWAHGLGTDVDTFIGVHNTFFISDPGAVEVDAGPAELAEVAISFPQEAPEPP